MSIKRFLIIAFLSLIGFTLEAATYYVATTGNDMTGNGSIISPWKTIQKGQSFLLPGDTLLVRGGTYPEEVIITVNGTKDNPITIKAYPNEMPVLDGTVSLTQWTQCAPDEPGLTVNGVTHPQATSIYKTDIKVFNDFDKLREPGFSRVVLFENGELAKIGRWPQQTDNFIIKISELEPLLPESYGVDTYIQDSTNLDRTNSNSYWYPWINGLSNEQLSSYWNGSWLTRRHLSGGNKIGTVSITEFDPDTHRLYVSPVLPNGATGQSDAYSINNHPHLVTQPGEYYHTKVMDSNGNITIYYWPIDINNLLNGNIGYAGTRGEAFFIKWKGGATGGFRENIHIEGFKIRGYRGGIHLNGDVQYAGRESGGYLIKDCVFENSAGANSASSAIYSYGIYDLVIDNCTVRNYDYFGFNLLGANDTTVQNCTISRTVGTCVYASGGDNYQVIGNNISEPASVHGNGIAIYGDAGSNKSVLVANNIVEFANNYALTFHNQQKLVVANNVLIGGSYYVMTHWSTGTDYHVVVNNTIISSASPQGDTALRFLTSGDGYIRNNITYGDAIVVGGNLTQSHNLYLAGTKEVGDIDGTNLSNEDIFVNPVLTTARNWQLKLGSPAIGSGISVISDLASIGVTSLFPSFDFTKDKNGNRWNTTPSIGAYEYNPGSTENRVPIAANDSFSIENNSTANSLTVLSNDSDSDGDNLTIASVTVPSHGTATRIDSNTKINYIPTVGYIGMDSFAYTVSDGNGGTSSATVTVTVEQDVQPPQNSSSDVTTGLIGDWRFNENYGEISVDHSGGANTATLVNHPQWNQGTILLDGTNDYITCSNDSTLNLTGDLTLSAWISPQSFGQAGYGRIIDKGTSNTGFTFFVNAANNNLGYTVYGGSLAFSNPNILLLNQWQHVAVTYDENTGQVSFYINGILSGQTAYSENPVDSESSPLVIGIRYYDMQRAFDGEIDSMRIYNRALTSEEISSLTELGRDYGLINSLNITDQSYPNFDKTLVKDRSGYSQDASVIAAPEWGDSYKDGREGWLLFNGTNQAVQISCDSMQAEAGTVALWVQPETTVGHQVLFGHSPAGNNRILLYTADGRLGVEVGDANQLATDTLESGVMQHVALTWNGTEYAVYLEGEQKISGTFSGLTALAATADIANVGADAYRSLDLGFNGFVDDVQIYNRALSAQEITTLSNTLEIKEMQNDLRSSSEI